MINLSQKIRMQRAFLDMSRDELAAKVGVTRRSIVAYEGGDRTPRPNTLIKLAEALNVSVRYLSDDECENPQEDIDRDLYIRSANEKYGTSGARDIDRLLKENMALFAGGDISLEEKDRFFEAVTKAYFVCREEARKRYGRKKKPAKPAEEDDA